MTLLLTLYALCGLALGFIVGYWYGFDTMAMRLHGKHLSLRQWFKRRIL